MLPIPATVVQSKSVITTFLLHPKITDQTVFPPFLLHSVFNRCSCSQWRLPIILVASFNSEMTNISEFFDPLKDANLN